MLKLAKKSLVFAMIIALIAVAFGCTKDDSSKKDDENKLTAKDKTAAYTALRIAEDKVNTVFHKSVAADETTPIIDPVLGTKEKAVDFLKAYYESSVIDTIVAHYVTDKTVDEGAVVVNADKFFEPSVLETKFEDVTISGTKKNVKIETKDGAVYEMKKVKDSYKVASIKK